MSAVSGRDAWAVGFYYVQPGYTKTLILRWNGAAWTKVKSPSPGCPHYDDSFNYLYGVSARSGSDAWAAGNYNDCTTQTDVRLVARWNGRAWADASAISTVTSVSSSSNPAATGNRVTYTATVASKGKVAPGPQGGIVAFYDNGSLISSCSDKALSSRSATCRVTYPSAGSHAIKAHYFGYADYVRSTSRSLIETATSCGVWRWPVKTGSDADRFKVSKAATLTSITHLAGLTAPSSFPPYYRKHRFRGAERHTWQLAARLTQFRLEDDGDIRLVLKDRSGRHMIADIPAPGCVANSSMWNAAIKSARVNFTHHFRVATSWHYVHRKIVIRGLGFFDGIHDITGQARNGIELHPVTRVRFP